MSSIASWSYTNKATVKPVIGRDKYGEPEFGEPYEIACGWSMGGQNWGANSKIGMADGGQEFIVRYEIYTEDPRPKYLDHVRLEGHELWEEIKSAREWEMSAFDDTSDYLLQT